ncbi:MAG: hypothetical protein N2450_00690 [bacterium]|nr:hypothetical protein [bacterium]
MKWLLLVLFWISFVFLGCTGSGPDIIENVGIPGARDYLLVVNEFSRTLSVLDLEQGRFWNANTSLESTPNHLIRRPNTDEYWVLHSDIAKIYRYRFRADTLNIPTFLDEIPLIQAGENPNPYFLAFSNDGRYFYTTNWLDHTVSRYEVATGIRESRIYVGEHPQGIVVLPNNNLAVTITDFRSTRQFGIGEVVIVDSLVTDTLKRITVDKNPQTIKLHNQVLYVVCTGDFANHTGKLWKLDANTFIPLATPISFQAYVSDLAIVEDSTGVWGYLPAWSMDQNALGSIQIVRLDTWQYDGYVAVNGGPIRVCSLPSGGVAVSLMEADQVIVKSKNRDWVRLTVGDGPSSILAVPK